MKNKIFKKLLSSAIEGGKMLQENMNDKQFEWSWCDYCEGPMVICPQCGNNSCNGHAGCALCEEIFEWEHEQHEKKLVPDSKAKFKKYKKGLLLQ